MLRLLVCLCALAVSVTPSCDQSIIPELTYRLSGSKIEWPCESTKNIYTTTGRYIPRNMIGTRAQLYNSEAIVAFPRYKSGIPITLGRVSLKKGSCYASVEPFPCWSIQEEGNCQAMQSVVDLVIDEKVKKIISDTLLYGVN